MCVVSDKVDNARYVLCGITPLTPARPLSSVNIPGYRIMHHRITTPDFFKTRKKSRLKGTILPTMNSI